MQLVYLVAYRGPDILLLTDRTTKLTTFELLTDTEIPDGTSYPDAFRRLVDRGLTHLEPWWVFDASIARPIMSGLKERYPSASLLPFAKREDNDDVACFERGCSDRVVVIHDFSSAGWERRQIFDDFYAWLRHAVEEMIEFDRGEV